MQRRVAIHGGFLRRHHAIAQAIQATERHGQCTLLQQDLARRLVFVHDGAHGVGHQPIHGLEQTGHVALALGIHANRAAQGDHAAHALRGLACAIHGEDTAQAPADQADLAARGVVDVANLLLQRFGMLGLKPHVAAKAPA